MRCPNTSKYLIQFIADQNNLEFIITKLKDFCNKHSWHLVVYIAIYTFYNHVDAAMVFGPKIDSKDSKKYLLYSYNKYFFIKSLSNIFIMQTDLLLNNQKYLEWINSNTLITKCQKKILLQHYTNKYNLYIKPDSNMQFITLISDIIKNDNVEEMARIILLLRHFINKKLTNNIIGEFKKYNKLTDQSVLDIITQKSEYIKSHDICDKWMISIERLALLYYQLFPLASKKNIKYLDIGCGNCKKTSFFAKNFDLITSNVSCTDIETWGPYASDKSKLPFNFKFIKNNKLDYENNQFDIITCILTLHHVQELDIFINEIYRILKKDGILILIEHCVYTDYDRLQINIQHLLYSVMFDKKEDAISNPDYMQTYNTYEWNYIMSNHNLKCIDHNVLQFGNEYSLSYDNIFYAIYQK